MVLVQKWPFFQLFFLGNIDKENVFYDILEGEHAFLGYKYKSFKKSKNWHFSKGPWFWSKNGHFSNFFFLGNIGQENVFNDILERINAFPGYKKNNPKSRKIYIFFKGVVNPWFWSKNDHFSNFFLSNIRQKNVFYDILELSNALLFYKNKKSKNLKKMTFFKKRLTHAFCPK